MRYDVNFILLGLLLVVIVAMISVAVLFNYMNSDLREKYESAMQEVENRSVELNRTVQEVNAKEILLRERERLLLDYISELNLSKEREVSLGSHFTELRGEKEVLDELLNQTRLERNNYAQLYSRTKENYDVCERNYDVKQTELNSANSRISSIKGWLVEVTEKADLISAKGGSIQTATSRVINDANNIKSLSSDNSIDAKADDIDDECTDIYGDAGDSKNYADRIKTIVEQVRSM